MTTIIKPASTPPIFHRNAARALQYTRAVWLSPTSDVPLKGWDAMSIRLLAVSVLSLGENQQRVVASNTDLDDGARNHLVIVCFVSCEARESPQETAGGASALDDTDVVGVNFSNYSRDSLTRKLARTDDPPAAKAERKPAQASGTVSGVPFHRLYVGNVHFSITEADLTTVFVPFGELEFVQLQKEENGRSRGYGFAKEALEKMNGFELAGRPIRVGLGNDKFTP
ncbi:RNA-binding domain-containing protein [Lophium mytilinum]|uniref:RNA-binding domain-containing protein n=1 Tax=Lophium mytilinum TaxID=390894 RepID=A0A6A6REZ8_9PEZI|nr:RNA-binding domain-containing protein [Lophium mytilinum]